MRALAVICLILLASCGEGAKHTAEPPIHIGLRDAFIELNHTMQRICDQEHVKCDMVNVGKEEFDGTGDFLWMAVEKIRRNFIALKG